MNYIESNYKNVTAFLRQGRSFFQFKTSAEGWRPDRIILCTVQRMTGEKIEPPTVLQGWFNFFLLVNLIFSFPLSELGTEPGRKDQTGT